MRSVRSADESCCCAQGSRHGNLREIRVGYHTSSVAVQEISQGDQEIGTYSIQLFQVSISSNPSDTMRCDAMRYKKQKTRAGQFQSLAPLRFALHHLHRFALTSVAW